MIVGKNATKWGLPRSTKRKCRTDLNYCMIGMVVPVSKRQTGRQTDRQMYLVPEHHQTMTNALLLRLIMYNRGEVLADDICPEDFLIRVQRLLLGSPDWFIIQPGFSHFRLPSTISHCCRRLIRQIAIILQFCLKFAFFTRIYDSYK